MELKHTNSNNEIVLEGKLNHVQVLSRKKFKLSLEIDPTHYFFKNLLKLLAKQEAS